MGEAGGGHARAAGAFGLAGLVAGALSVVPVLERPDWLLVVADHEQQVLTGAVAQVLMAPAAIGFALCLYPLLRCGGGALAVGFVALRVLAGGLHLLAALLLPLLVALGSAAAQAQDGAALLVVGELLREGRDLLNHVAVVTAVALGDALFLTAARRARLLPGWLVLWGLAGAALTLAAGVLVLVGAVGVVTPLYLGANLPAAAHTLVLAGWLLVRGVGGRARGRSAAG